MNLSENTQHNDHHDDSVLAESQESGHQDAKTNKDQSLAKKSETSSDQPLISITGEYRKRLGKSGARKVRKTGLVPANILQGHTSLAISMPSKWLTKVWQTGGVFSLTLSESCDSSLGMTNTDSDKQTVYQKVKIHEVQLHPVKRVPIHLDLLVITE
ncbi:MAG: hypothetical protein OXC40_05660 [Proteobacteria bacterium]|nr:hypothetical protein [Pseudomonadota bacterium]